MMRSASTKRERVGQSVSRGILLAHPAYYAKEVLADTPTAFWKYQDAARTLPVDISGNGLDMTTEDKRGHWRAAGPFNYSTDATRSAPADPRQPGDWSIANAAYRRSIVSAAQNNWTMELWIMTQGVYVDAMNIFGNGDRNTNAGGANNGYDLFWSGTGGKFQVGYASVSVNTDSAVSIAANLWYHIVVTRSAGTLIYYVNGAVDTANADSTHTPIVPTNGASGGTKVGCQSTTALQTIAYPAFYTTVLSPTRVTAHFAAMVGG